jgi:uncharacterized heparinase superfamily protein
VASASLARVRRIAETLRYLRPMQVFYYVWRRGFGARRIEPWRGPVRARVVEPRIHADPGLAAATDAPAAEFRFAFLNHELSFPRARMDWNPAAATRLWRYNLHYFDFLTEGDRPLAEKGALIDDWIAHNPQGSAPAWEPYTASLRIVNWCKFFSSLPPADIASHWLRALYDQARWLEKNLELHILANHYFENVKALLFAGSFFDDENSARWLKKFQPELIAQLKEQLLPDGGHYERSPQYHCLVLVGLLDLFELAQQRPSIFSSQTLAALEHAIQAMLAVAQTLQTPDDDIPLFNDSASSAGMRPSTIIGRASCLGFPTGEISGHNALLLNLPDTGLYGWKAAADYFLVDCGAIGPDYQPGHTHCDLLSYVLMLDGHWLVVDSGVFEYEPGAMRHYVRSTAAHNTVTVDAQEQSEVWGEFRVGRRARVLHAGIEHAADSIAFSGTFEGFPALGGHITHRRNLDLQIEEDKVRYISVMDSISGSSSRSLKSYIHLHPAIHVELRGRVAILNRSGAPIARVVCEVGQTIGLEEGWYCPEHGLKERNGVLVLACTGPLPATLSYRLERLLPCGDSDRAKGDPSQDEHGPDDTYVRK